MSDKRSNILVPLIVACGLFMENLDSSVINTALPAIATSLKVSPTHLSLAITSYLLSLAIFTPLSGWIADRFGTRNVFRIAIGVFTISSIACGLSETLPQLVMARIIQGMGGAMMVPVGRLALLKSVPKSELVDALAWMTIPALIGPVIGPMLGGLIVTYSSWQWIFFINLPIGIIGIILVTLFIEDSRETDTAPFDMVGFAFIAIALGGIIFSLETLGREFIPNHASWTLLILGIASLGSYALYFKRSAHPIIDLSLFKTPTFMTAIAGGALFRIGVGALPFLLPIMLQVGFGLTPLASGMITFASAAGSLIMKFTAARIIRSFGFRRILIYNAIISGASIMLCGIFDISTPHIVILLILLIGGFFRSLQYTGMNSLAFSDIQQPMMSQATTISSMMQQLSYSIGVVMGAMLLNLTLFLRDQPSLGANDFWPSIIIAGLLPALSAIFFLKLNHDAGGEVSGHPTPRLQATDHSPI
ncbi:MAG: MFS transporter [Alphaproteobacteria bacterium]|nr:MFS transporter [Alphaproteobacteria bacterium]